MDTARIPASIAAAHLGAAVAGNHHLTPPTLANHIEHLTAPGSLYGIGDCVDDGIIAALANGELDSTWVTELTVAYTTQRTFGVRGRSGVVRNALVTSDLFDFSDPRAVDVISAAVLDTRTAQRCLLNAPLSIADDTITFRHILYTATQHHTTVDDVTSALAAAITRWLPHTDIVGAIILNGDAGGLLAVAEHPDVTGEQLEAVSAITEKVTAGRPQERIMLATALCANPNSTGNVIRTWIADGSINVGDVTADTWTCLARLLSDWTGTLRDLIDTAERLAVGGYAS